MHIIKKGEYLSLLLQYHKSIITVDEISLLWNHPHNSALRSKIYYYVKKGTLIPLRQGIYALTKQYNKAELGSCIYRPSYLSFETVLAEHGIIFQYYETQFFASYLTKSLDIDTNTYQYRKVKDDLLFSPEGILSGGTYSKATKERAFLDMLYLFPNYHMDHTRSIDKETIKKLLPLYQNIRLEKEVSRLLSLSLI